MTTQSSMIEELHSGTADDCLQRGRASYAEFAWQDAFESLSAADALHPLRADDLQRLAWAAALTARDAEMLASTERLYKMHLTDGKLAAAARSAFWLGYKLVFLGEPARAAGWFARAQRLVEDLQQSCAEQGYLLLPLARRQFVEGDLDAADVTVAQAVRIGTRFDEPDLVALAQSLHGRIFLRKGLVQQGLALIDEVMLAATRGELSPLVAGLVYCSMIESCQRVYALDRAREWTAALSAWCECQPQLVMFAGPCIVHRAEIMELGGAWGDALAEAQRASDRVARSRDPAGVAADAYYQQAEILRLRGQFEAAEEAYGHASQLGREPQPGLALLRLAQGRNEAAVSALRRLVESTRDDLQRTRFLPAYVEALLAVGDREAANGACEDLEAVAARVKMAVLSAMADHARGIVLLSIGDAKSAAAHLRGAFRLWHELGAPYIAAKIRLLLGCALRSVGDEDSAQLEFNAAREVFTRLGAEPDRATAEQMALGRVDCRHRGLTQRELQVLRLVATGKTNKSIAAGLCLSEKTIDRHVNNIFTKIEVSSRAAATAYAYDHKLL
jgi:DNA-binding NarL/FixJ family response regulator